MKVLIIEDNERKLNDTVKYVQNVCKEVVEIDCALCITEGKRYLKENKYDRVIIDMQMPSTRNSSIDRFGGITILNYLPHTINADTRHIVNSSSDETREVLDNNNFPLVGLIVNSSMYDCTKQFELFINGLKYVEETKPVTESILDGNDNSANVAFEQTVKFKGNIDSIKEEFEKASYSDNDVVGDGE